jgi:hypothetical protein
MMTLSIKGLISDPQDKRHSALRTLSMKHSGSRAVMLNVIMLSVRIFVVVMLNVVMLNVVAPSSVCR